MSRVPRRLMVSMTGSAFRILRVAQAAAMPGLLLV